MLSFVGFLKKMNLFNLILILFLFSECTAQHTDSDNFIEKSSLELEQFKNTNNIKGLSFAVFTSKRIVFQESLGKSTYNYPLTNKTLFSIQSISKNITALGVMFALQDGLIGLDEPIKLYLPDFKVNSCFEDNPERKITLGMLLSHTAGFTHETTIGNNYDFRKCDMNDHLKSIEDTWLKFPPGIDYAYSNIGFDLAAKIIETKSGMKFNEYLKEKVFRPLNMESTTLDDSEFLTNTNKTEGTIPAIKTNHYTIPLMGSGAVYTNLSDLIKYVQFQMNLGVINEKTILQKEHFFKMYQIHFNYYGLGTYLAKNDGDLYINHNGSGYGFSASFVWYPEYDIGMVLLCNKQLNTFAVCETIFENYRSSFQSKKSNPLSDEIESLNKHYFENSACIDQVQLPHCSNDTLFKPGWEKYLGNYFVDFQGLEFKWYSKIALTLGLKPRKIEIYKENNTLKIRGMDGESVLRAYKPGLFFTNNNELLDLNKLTYRNIKLEK